MSRVLVTGVPGVGKSTILQRLPADVRQSVINFGSLMLNVLSEPADSRDALRSLPAEDLLLIRDEAARRLPDCCIIDCHLSIIRAGVVTSSIPSKYYEPKFLAGIVILEADPRVVLERRVQRPAREDAPQVARDVRTQQDRNRLLAKDIANRGGCWVAIVDANQEVDAVARDIVSRISIPQDNESECQGL